jgi:hypothetical protein
MKDGQFSVINKLDIKTKDEERARLNTWQMSRKIPPD